MKKPEINNIEVDMVPLIDIIVLLLMFLIIVGDSTASSNIASLRLPAADQAKTEKEWNLPTEGRIVVQVKPDDPDEPPGGKYHVIFNAAKHEAGKSLKDHLLKYISEAEGRKQATKGKDGAWDIPVKVRIPAKCPMEEAEKVLATIASVGLVDIHYATSADGKK